jgi:hypothetical protein
MSVVDALFRRGATKRIPEKLKLAKLKKDTSEDGGLILPIREFRKPRKKEITGPQIVRQVQIRIRRKVC